MNRPVNLVLVPGFFAFDQVANIPYFAGVERILPALGAQRGFSVNLIKLSLPPTASIQIRAWALMQQLGQMVDTPGPIYLVGHSSGGLDIRVALRLAMASQPNRLWGQVLGKVSAVLTISTPHYGTPWASLASGLRAHQILRLTSWIFVRTLRHGQVPMGWMLEAGRWLARIDNLVGLNTTVLDQLYNELLIHAPRDYFEDLERQFQRVGAHQGLIADLSLEACRLRNRACPDIETIRYGSIVSQAPRPNLGAVLALRGDVYAAMTYMAFVFLHKIAGRSPKGKLPVPDARDRECMQAALGRVPRDLDNDGVVPARSQLWGQLVATVGADHFDTMGYFAGREEHALHLNWLSSGSGFCFDDYLAMWSDALDFLFDIKAKSPVLTKEAQLRGPALRAVTEETDRLREYRESASG